MTCNLFPGHGVVQAPTYLTAGALSAILVNHEISRPGLSRKLTVCSSGDESDYSDVSDEEDLKLVLVVRQDLKMGKGKAAAQCSHATLAAYKRARRKCPDRLKVWESTGQPKITLKCDSEEELMLLMVKARSLDLVSYVVADAGRTQIAPGSHTVLAVGPAPGQLVDQVVTRQSVSLGQSDTLCFRSQAISNSTKTGGLWLVV